MTKKSADAFLVYLFSRKKAITDNLKTKSIFRQKKCKDFFPQHMTLKNQPDKQGYLKTSTRLVNLHFHKV